MEDIETQTMEDMTAHVNDALEAGDLNRIMGTLGQITRAHRMKRVAQETGLGEKSLYKSMRAGASPEFNTVLKVLRALGFRLQVTPNTTGETNNAAVGRDRHTQRMNESKSV